MQLYARHVKVEETAHHKAERKCLACGTACIEKITSRAIGRSQ
jgi:hypothetical protein